MPLSSLNNFLKTCGVQETAIPTASVTIKDDMSVREQISFYMSNVKNIPHFETFWARYGTQLPDLVSVLKYYSCMQCSSVRFRVNHHFLYLVISIENNAVHYLHLPFDTPCASRISMMKVLKNKRYFFHLFLSSFLI